MDDHETIGAPQWGQHGPIFSEMASRQVGFRTAFAKIRTAIYVAVDDVREHIVLGQNTVRKINLRGVPFTDQHGLVTFKTILPGHYSGRTTHINIGSPGAETAQS